jgi:Fic family protein
MHWNWQHPEWPEFRWQPEKYRRQEDLFLQHAGVIIGAQSTLNKDNELQLAIDLMGCEALGTSQIEGEMLDRQSIQASIRKQLGLGADRRAGPAETGVASMMVDLYHNLGKPLTESQLFRWHELIMNGRWDISVIGHYRVHDDEMEIVSGPVGRHRVHFVAPPAKRLPREMSRFYAWLEHSAPEGPAPIPALVRAGIAHLWFETLHPFEDGNGRLGRALVENALAEGINRPVLTGISSVLLQRRTEYYQALAGANRTLDIDPWLGWFVDAVLEAQQRTLAQVRFVISKGRYLAQHDARFNLRQRKAVLRLFDAGIDGFVGGLSAENYRRITGAPVSTATRDLTALVEIGALWRTGEKKGTRYHLCLTDLD